jgi:uncharacterized OB-fold protein
MATIRDIIGHVSVETAKAKRICYHNKKNHSILMGQKCLVVGETDQRTKNYCQECGTAILTKAKSKLAELEQTLQS